METFDTMKKCPHCGGKLPRAALACRYCGRSLIARAVEYRPGVWISMLLGLLLFFTVGLLGLLIIDLNRFYGLAIWIYLILVFVFLVVLSARGRYGTPTIGQYLISLVVTALPVLGTIYAFFYAGRHMAQFRRMRYLVYGLLIVATGMSFLRYSDFDFVNTALSSQSTLAPPFTSTPQLQSTPSPQPTSSSASPTVTSAPPSPTTAPTIFDCTLWSDLDETHVGENLCVYGEFIRHYERDDGTFVMIFSEDPGTFQIWSYPKPMDVYLQGIAGNCVMAFGWLMTSGVRPIIVLRTSDVLHACP